MARFISVYKSSLLFKILYKLVVTMVERGIETINPRPKGIIEIKTINDISAPKVSNSKKTPSVTKKLAFNASITPHSSSTRK